MIEGLQQAHKEREHTANEFVKTGLFLLRLRSDEYINDRLSYWDNYTCELRSRTVHIMKITYSVNEVGTTTDTGETIYQAEVLVHFSPTITKQWLGTRELEYGTAYRQARKKHSEHHDFYNEPEEPIPDHWSLEDIMQREG